MSMVGLAVKSYIGASAALLFSVRFGVREAIDRFVGDILCVEGLNNAELAAVL